MGEVVTVPCPVCGERTAVKHCQSTSCGWAKCRNAACLSVVDPSRKRGFRPTTKAEQATVRAPDGKPASHIPVTF